MTETENQPLLQNAFSSNESGQAEYSETRLDVTRRETRRFLNSKVGHYSVLLLVGLDVSCIFADFIIQILTCEGRIPPKEGEVALQTLGVAGLVFSCLFMAELLTSICAFGSG